MPANHCMPHTAESKAKMSAARLGKPAPWKRRPTQTIDGVIMYRCGRCALFLSREDFYADRRNDAGIKSYCKRCHSTNLISSRNKDVKRRSAIAYEATRRARKAGCGGVVTRADWESLLGILGSACLRCGSNSRITQDHIVPLSKGGRHHPTNLQPLCRPCNERKQATTRDYRSTKQAAHVAEVWVLSFQRVESADRKVASNG